jgi:hypothetical protein
VAEPSDKPPKDAEDLASAGDAGDGRSASGQQQPIQIQIDDSRALTAYANFFRVAGMPEELILDFGLNSQPVGVPTRPILVNLRVILNFYTAKRMLHALQLAIQRHEAAFGVLETDVQKRVRPGAMGRPPGQPP